MKKAVAIFLILALAMLPGCWDSREINDLCFVVAVGIDKATDSGNYIITVQIANPSSNIQANSPKSNTSEPFFVMSAEGSTLFDATRQLSKTSSKRIMWAHDFIIIIGESLAKDSIAPVIDYFTHNPELRMKTAIVVSKGNAMDYLAIKSGMEEIPAVSFSSIYEYNRLTGEYIETSMLSLSRDYYGTYSQPLVSAVSFKKNKILPSDQITKDLTDQVQFGGAAVFNKDKMLGWLTPEETKGLAWVLNQTTDTLVTVQEPFKPTKSVSVETHGVTTKIITRIDNGKPSVTFEISGSGSIVEEDETTTLPMDEFKKVIGGFVDKNIGNNVKMSMDKIQKVYQSDVLGLAKSIRAQHYEEWNSMIEDHWNDIYPKLPITIKVDITINESTLNQIPENDIEKN